MSESHNIGILLSLSRYAGGAYQWTINILYTLEAYRKANSKFRIHIFYYSKVNDSSGMQEEFPDFYYHNVGRIVVFLTQFLVKVFKHIPFLLPLLRYCYPLNFISVVHKIDLMIFPGASFDASFYINKQMFMFTDIAHVFYPNFREISSNSELKSRNLLFKYGIKNASHIVLDSNQLCLDVIKYYNADKAKIEVLYQTISQTIKNIKCDDKECSDFVAGLPSTYLFYPAQLWEHKNHKNLLLAMKILMNGYKDLFLILAGSKKEGSEDIFTLMKESALQNNVRYLGYIQDKFMPLLYKKAQMLVMPTYFGPTNIPTLEAFYFGCPAVISDIPGVKEQTGDAALLFDPSSPQDIADKISLVLHNYSLRKEMVKKGYDRMKFLSFDNYREKLINILEKCLN